MALITPLLHLRHQPESLDGIRDSGGMIDTIYGYDGNDTINGGDGNDKLFGGTGDDLIDGGFGFDTINGGDGNDKLFGGTGDDLIDGGFGFDTIDGGLGNDTTSYAFYWGPINANLATGVVSFPGNSLLTDTLVSIENLIGTAGNDTIIGNTANNSLNGGAGNDSINGGDGVDTLIGGAGNDTLTGGAGADKFRFNFLSEKVDTIQDFFWSEGDKIEVSASGFGATSLSQISYNAGSGSLSFLGTQFAKIANLPAGFVVSLDVALI